MPYWKALRAIGGSLPAAVPREGSAGQSHSQDSAIHRHSINKSASLFYPGDKHGGHEIALPCVVCAERGSLCWLPKELRHCCCGTCCGQAGNGAAGCQAVWGWSPAVPDTARCWCILEAASPAGGVAGAGGHCLSQLMTFSLECQGQPSCSKSHFKRKMSAASFQGVMGREDRQTTYIGFTSVVLHLELLGKTELGLGLSCPLLALSSCIHIFSHFCNIKYLHRKWNQTSGFWVLSAIPADGQLWICSIYSFCLTIPLMPPLTPLCCYLWQHILWSQWRTRSCLAGIDFSRKRCWLVLITLLPLQYLSVELSTSALRIMSRPREQWPSLLNFTFLSIGLITTLSRHLGISLAVHNLVKQKTIQMGKETEEQDLVTASFFAAHWTWPMSL